MNETTLFPVTYKDIKAVAYAATLQAIQAEPDTTRGHCYPHFVEAAQAGIAGALLDFTHGNQSKAADLGGLNRATLRSIQQRAHRQTSREG